MCPPEAPVGSSADEKAGAVLCPADKDWTASSRAYPTAGGGTGGNLVDSRTEPGQVVPNMQLGKGGLPHPQLVICKTVSMAVKHDDTISLSEAGKGLGPSEP